MSRRGKRYEDLVSTDLRTFYNIRAVRRWREDQHAAGQPSGLEDFYQAHSLCWTCKATGVTVGPVDWDGEIPLFENCPVCNGTGKLTLEKRGLPWHEAVSKVAPKPMSLDEIKAWRTREAAAGRPSSYEQFCQVHGLCVTCLGEGLTYNDNGIGFKIIGMDGVIPLFERCPVCGGTGRQTTTPLMP